MEFNMHNDVIEKIRIFNEKSKLFEHIVTVGDIHGDVQELGFRIKERYKIRNSLIFLCGDLALGFEKENYHITEYTKLNNIAKNTNNLIIGIRGNHDNPAWFENSWGEFSNIIFVPDYTVIESKYKRILCIGGAVSIDRSGIPMQVVPRILGYDYWEEEIPVYDEQKLKAAGYVDIVLSHTAPAFCEFHTKDNLSIWIKHDKNLEADMNLERKVFSDIFDFLQSNNIKIDYWCYGHFHKAIPQDYFNVKFRMLAELEFFEIPIIHSEIYK